MTHNNAEDWQLITRRSKNGYDFEDSTYQSHFTASGDDRNKTDRSAEGKLALSIDMLHAAGNFIYEPDKEWEAAAT